MSVVKHSFGSDVFLWYSSPTVVIDGRGDCRWRWVVCGHTPSETQQRSGPVVDWCGRIFWTRSCGPTPVTGVLTSWYSFFMNVIDRCYFIHEQQNTVRYKECVVDYWTCTRLFHFLVCQILIWEVCKNKYIRGIS